MITFEVYKSKIQQHYKEIIAVDSTAILINPSPAQMRDFCIYILDNGISKTDEAVLKTFFETKENEPLRKSIERCNTDKFKTIIAFLKQSRDTSKNLRVEVAAIITGYKHRPYSVFQKQEIQPNNIVEIKETNIVNNKPQQNIDAKPPTIPTVKTNKTSRNIKFGILVFLSMIGIGYTVNTFFPKKDCMYWKKDHYEATPCDCEIQGIYNAHTVIPINQQEFLLKRIYPCDTTTFFNEYGKPKIWYHKMNNKIEYFNQDGIHPVTGKDLHPITKYMIKTHHLDEMPCR